MVVNAIQGNEQFEKEVLRSSTPVFVDLWAAWCGPCKMYGPVVEEVSEKFSGKVKFVKVNVDDNEDIAAKYGVQSIPTSLLIEGGKVKATTVGAINVSQLEAWLKKNV